MAAETTAALMTTLRASNDQVQTLLDHGALAQLYLPALAAKDTALVLDARADALPADRRASVHSAVKRIVIAAWQIDRDGDLGDRRRLDDACRMFSEAITALMTAYE